MEEPGKTSCPRGGLSIRKSWRDSSAVVRARDTTKPFLHQEDGDVLFGGCPVRSMTPPDGLSWGQVVRGYLPSLHEGCEAQGSLAGHGQRSSWP